MDARSGWSLLVLDDPGVRAALRALLAADDQRGTTLDRAHALAAAVSAAVAGAEERRAPGEGAPSVDGTIAALTPPGWSADRRVALVTCLRELVEILEKGDPYGADERSALEHLVHLVHDPRN